MTDLRLTAEGFCDYNSIVILVVFFDLKVKKLAGIEEITGTSVDVVLQTGVNASQETVELEIKGKHLEYKAKPKQSCCPESDYDGDLDDD